MCAEHEVMTMDMDKTKLRNEVDSHIDQLIQRFYEEVPNARHMMSAKELNMDYYKRNLIEIILRLRMKRTIDGLTITYFTRHDPVLAKKWCQYTEDEMLHDRMFASDLDKVGVSKDEIYSQEPLLSTKLLQGYFYYGLEHEGRPLASLCSSYFIETTSQKTQPKWLDHIETVLGKDKIKGQRAHVNHDADDDHVDFVWDVLMTFVKDEDDARQVFAHLDNVYELFCMYFRELHAVTAQA
jgi:hypothetical protein